MPTCVSDSPSSRYIRKIGIATAIGGNIRVERIKNRRSSLSGTLKREKRISRERAEKDRKKGRAEADDDRVEVTAGKARGAGDHHVARAHELVVPGRSRRQARHVLGRLAGAVGEQVDVALEGGLEDDLGRVGDRLGGRLEAGHEDPDHRDQRDQRIGDHDRPGEPARERRRQHDRVGLGRGAHRCFTRFSDLDVDVGGAEHGDEQDGRERRAVAGPPVLERLALQVDRGELGDRARAARGQIDHHVEHLEVLDGAEQAPPASGTAGPSGIVIVQNWRQDEAPSTSAAS